MFPFILFILCTLTIANATPDAVPGTTPHRDESTVVTIHVNKDGSYQKITRKTITINTQDAAENFRGIHYDYTPENEHTTQKVLVNSRPCKTKIHIATRTKENTQKSSQTISLYTRLPRLNIGDTITVEETTQKKHKTNFFTYVYIVPTSGQFPCCGPDKYTCKQYTYTLTSEMPIQFAKNDPDGLFNVKRKDAHTLHITTNKPLVLPRKGPDESTAFYVSTALSYPAINKTLSAPFDKELTKKHPPHVDTIIQAIAQQALQKTTDVDRINCAKDLMSKHLCSYPNPAAPHTFDPILTTFHKNDVKTATFFTAILRKMGYDAWLGLITRDRKTTVPMPEFDHIIVKATNKNGKTYWLDTIGIIMPGIIPAHMENKKVLVLDGKSDRETIPVNDPKDHHHIERSETTIDFETGHTQTDTKESRKGNPAYRLHQLVTTASNKAERMHALRNVWRYGSEATTITWSDITHVGKDVTFSTHRKSSTPLKGSNAGYVWDELEPFQGPTTNDSGGFGLAVETRKYTHILKNTRIDNCDRLNYTFESEWMDQSRTVEQKGPDVHITEYYIGKKPRIPSEIVQSQAFQEKIKKCGNRLNMAAIVKEYTNAGN
jgi:hypothetical protein